MEACFLTSRSVSSAKELLPLIKTRISSCPKRNSSRFQTRKVKFSSRVTCCKLDSWTPMDDDEHINTKNSIPDSDWRNFRARLVAGELGSRPDNPSSWTDPDVALGYPPLVTIGNKWAHVIHEPEKGCLLIATEKLDGAHIFERTVILLLSVGPTGPIGIILNRPSLMSIKETKSTVLDIAGTFSDKKLFFGGPLEEGVFLVSPEEGSGVNGNNEEVGRSGVFREVMKGLYYGTRESVGLAAEMVKRNLIKGSEVRFFEGYCRWGKEQLREEIQGGYWTVVASSASVVGLGNGSVNSHGLWDEIHGLIGRKQVL